MGADVSYPLQPKEMVPVEKEFAHYESKRRGDWGDGAKEDYPRKKRACLTPRLSHAFRSSTVLKPLLAHSDKAAHDLSSP